MIVRAPNIDWTVVSSGPRAATIFPLTISERYHAAGNTYLEHATGETDLIDCLHRFA